ncbi:MAG: hypothetical protein COB53_02530 [Elusimicrobia bacterium]|nr:MAG: hypothetical protein COB53_02530 [Elusimicrobiota bacterium]
MAVTAALLMSASTLVFAQEEPTNYVEQLDDSTSGADSGLDFTSISGLGDTGEADQFNQFPGPFRAFGDVEISQKKKDSQVNAVRKMVIQEMQKQATANGGDAMSDERVIAALKNMVLDGEGMAPIFMTALASQMANGDEIVPQIVDGKLMGFCNNTAQTCTGTPFRDRPEEATESLIDPCLTGACGDPGQDDTLGEERVEVESSAEEEADAALKTLTTEEGDTEENTEAAGEALSKSYEAELTGCQTGCEDTSAATLDDGFGTSSRTTDETKRIANESSDGVDAFTEIARKGGAAGKEAFKALATSYKKAHSGNKNFNIDDLTATPAQSVASIQGTLLNSRAWREVSEMEDRTIAAVASLESGREDHAKSLITNSADNLHVTQNDLLMKSIDTCQVDGNGATLGQAYRGSCS